MPWQSIIEDRWTEKSVSVPNKEVSQEYVNEISTMIEFH